MLECYFRFGLVIETMKMRKRRPCDTRSVLQPPVMSSENPVILPADDQLIALPLPPLPHPPLAMAVRKFNLGKAVARVGGPGSVGVVVPEKLDARKMKMTVR